MVRVKWLNSAKNDLKEIYNFISLDSRKYAKLQVEKIKSRTEILKTQSHIGKVNEEYNHVSVRELIEGNYRIIYRIVSDSEIHILMIHHSARDLNRRLHG